MAWVNVSTVAQLEGLLAAGQPRALRIVGADSVRSAATMLHLLQTHGLIVPEAEAVGDEGVGEEEEEVGGGSSSEDCNAAGDSVGEEASAYADSDDADDSDYSDDSDSDNSDDYDDDDRLENWIVEGVDPLRRAARLANLLIEMRDVVIPALAVAPADVAHLHRLRDLGKDVRRAGLLVPGVPGGLAVTLGNKTQKLVSHAFSNRQGGARSLVDRGRWIAQRRLNLLNQVNGVLATALPLH